DDAEQSHEQRDTRSEDEPGEDIAAEVVGAENVEIGRRRQRWEQRVPHVDRRWVVGCDQRAQDRYEDDHCDDRQPHTEGPGRLSHARAARSGCVECCDHGPCGSFPQSLIRRSDSRNTTSPTRLTRMINTATTKTDACTTGRSLFVTAL